MAKKQANPVDLRAELKKRVKVVDAEITALEIELHGCINERAHLKQYYWGRMNQATAEVEYLKGLLDA